MSVNGSMEPQVDGSKTRHPAVELVVPVISGAVVAETVVGAVAVDPVKDQGALEGHAEHIADALGDSAAAIAAVAEDGSSTRPDAQKEV